MRPTVTGMIKLALPAGKANPAPPVGPALGAKVRRACCHLPCAVLLAACRVCACCGAQPQLLQGLRVRLPPTAAAFDSPQPAQRLPCRSPPWLVAWGPPQPCAVPVPPSPPHCSLQGVNIMQFCKEYNAATQDKAGMIIPVSAAAAGAQQAAALLGAAAATGAEARSRHAARLPHHLITYLLQHIAYN